MIDLSSQAADSGNGGKLGQIVLTVGHQPGGPGVEAGDHVLPAVDLVQVVPDHERVVIGEIAVQRLDEGRDLVAGPADREIGQATGVTLPGDEGLQDGPATGAGHVAEDRRELHPRVLELLL